jgi:hypothetical protein
LRQAGGAGEKKEGRSIRKEAREILLCPSALLLLCNPYAAYHSVLGIMFNCPHIIENLKPLKSKKGQWKQGFPIRGKNQKYSTIDFSKPPFIP